MTGTVITNVGFGVFIALILADLLNLIRPRRLFYLLEVLAHVVIVTGCVIAGQRLQGLTFTVYGAVWLWLWWICGGGDGTRRRLRRRARRFKARRRTAPVLGA